MFIFSLQQMNENSNGSDVPSWCFDKTLKKVAEEEWINSLCEISLESKLCEASPSFFGFNVSLPVEFVGVPLVVSHRHKIGTY